MTPSPVRFLMCTVYVYAFGPWYQIVWTFLLSLSPYLDVAPLFRFSKSSIISNLLVVILIFQPSYHLVLWCVSSVGCSMLCLFFKMGYRVWGGYWGSRWRALVHERGAENVWNTYVSCDLDSLMLKCKTTEAVWFSVVMKCSVVQCTVMWCCLMYCSSV